MRAQAGLDRIHQQQRAVRFGQLACSGIECRRNGAAWVAFAHHRLQEHGFEVPAMGLGISEGLAQRIDRIRLDGNEAIFATKTGQMLHIRAAAGIGI